VKAGQRITIGEVCSFLNGGTPSKSVERYFQGDIPWITGADITSPVVTNARSFITKEAVASSATNRVPAGTVLLVTRTSVGKVATAGVDLCFSQDITALTPDASRLHATYLVEFLKTQEAHFECQARGATIKGITRQVVGDLEIPLPPLAEQRRIAEVLDRAEALRAKRRAALAQLDSLTQSLFLDLFGDTVSNGWAMTDIAGVARPVAGSIRTGPFGSQLLHSEFTDCGIAVLGIDNAVANEFRWSERRFISEAKYRQLKRYTVHPGDVLITIMGTCGRCAVVPDDIPPAINTKHLCCITLDPAKCLPLFLHAYFLQHPIARKYLTQTAKGAIMSGLNMGLIKGMPIPLPPLPLQREFARRVGTVEKLKTAQRASLAELDALFAALQHRAFRGEL
jgi:type I restriction enzyme S subunit